MLTLLRNNRERPELGSSKGGWEAFQPKASSACTLATGRSTLRLLANRLNPDVVLMPSYVAEGVLRPFLAEHVRIKFYRLDEDLSPNLEDVGSILGQTTGKALVILIHYFGYIFPAETLGEMIRARGGFLLEDCAQALLSRAPDGQPFPVYGDFVLYSLNKFLPVTDGALLLSRRPETSVALEEAELEPLNSLAYDAYAEHLSLNAALLATQDPTEARKLIAASGRAYEDYYQIICSDMGPKHRGHHSILVEELTDFVAMATRRHANAALLHDALAADPAVHLMQPRLLPNTSPFCVPVRVRAERRDAFCDALLQAGILASTQIDKWNFLPENELQRFTVETMFMAEHLLLPVSEFLDADDMSHIINAVTHLTS
jgi:dTDP-4-amino-4,6-dideoxygalactose transaminase